MTETQAAPVTMSATYWNHPGYRSSTRLSTAALSIAFAGGAGIMATTVVSMTRVGVTGPMPHWAQLAVAALSLATVAVFGVLTYLGTRSRAVALEAYRDEVFTDLKARYGIEIRRHDVRGENRAHIKETFGMEDGRLVRVGLIAAGPYRPLVLTRI